MKRLIKNTFLSLFTIGSCVAAYLAFEKIYKEKENQHNDELEVIEEMDPTS